MFFPKIDQVDTNECSSHHKSVCTCTTPTCWGSVWEKFLTNSSNESSPGTTVGSISSYMASLNESSDDYHKYIIIIGKCII